MIIQLPHPVVELIHHLQAPLFLLLDPTTPVNIPLDHFAGVGIKVGSEGKLGGCANFTFTAPLHSGLDSACNVSLCCVSPEILLCVSF